MTAEHLGDPELFAVCDDNRALRPDELTEVGGGFGSRCGAAGSPSLRAPPYGMGWDGVPVRCRSPSRRADRVQVNGGARGAAAAHVLTGKKSLLNLALLPAGI